MVNSFYISNLVEFEQNELDPFELLREVINKMKRHESKEKKTSILEDKTLIGYIDLTKVFIFFKK